MSFPARWHSWCPECHQEIEVGNEIESRDEGGYRHVVCPESQRAEDKPTKFQGTTLEDMGY